MQNEWEPVDSLDGMISTMQRAIPRNEQSMLGVFAKQIDQLQSSLDNKVDEIYHNILNNYNKTTLNTLYLPPKGEEDIPEGWVCRNNHSSKSLRGNKENLFELVSKKMILNSTSNNNLAEGSINTQHLFKSAKKRELIEENRLKDMKQYLRKTSGSKVALKPIQDKQNHLIVFQDTRGRSNLELMASKSDLLELLDTEEAGKQRQRKVYRSKPEDLGRREAETLKIQSALRTFLTSNHHTNILLKNRSAALLQNYWRAKTRLSQTRAQIKSKNLKILQRFRELQDTFKQSWPSIKYQNRVEIHVANSQLDSFQKLNTENLRQIQNTLITRIFRSKDSEVTVIYVSPINISTEIIAYYRKIIEMTQYSGCKFHFVTPENQVVRQESVLTSLLGSPKCMKRIKDLIKNKIAYIVPGHSSIQYCKLSVELNSPVYGCVEQSRYFQLTSSIPRLVSEQYTLPSRYDIYSMNDLYSSLSTLIYSYPTVPRWYLKTEDSRRGRGIAYIDTYSFSEFRSLQDKIMAEYKDSTISYISIILQDKLKQKLKILSPNLYRSYQQYIKQFLMKGGYIEASGNESREVEANNMSVMVEIEPSQQWKIIGSYEKVTLRQKSIGYQFLESVPTPLQPVLVETLLKISKKLGYFGYIVFDFIKKNEQEYYMIGIDAYLNEAISAYNMVSLFTPSPQPIFLYCPTIFEKGIRDLQFKTFFQFCRLEGISFDINEHSGSIFTFVDSLQSSCLGLISVANSRKEVYRLMNKTIQFISKNTRKQQHLSVLRNDAEISLEDISHRLRIIHKKMVPRESTNLSLIPLGL